MGVRVDITEKGIGPIEIIRLVRKVRKDIVEEVIEIGEETAKKELKAKMISKSSNSPLIDSFVAKVGTKGQTVNGYIIAGNTKAYYADWVDKGHKLVNGKFWDGYEFMEAAGQKMEKILPVITEMKINGILLRGRL